MSSQPTAMNRQLFRTYTKLLMWHFHTINITTCKVCSKILCQSCATFFVGPSPMNKATLICFDLLLPSQQQPYFHTHWVQTSVRLSVHPSVCGLPFMAATTLSFTPYCNKEFFAFPDFSFFLRCKKCSILRFCCALTGLPSPYAIFFLV